MLGAFRLTRLLLTTAFGRGEGATPRFLETLLPAIPRPVESTLDRETRAEESGLEVRGLKVVPRLEFTFLDRLPDCLVVICGARLLGLGAGREEMLGRGGGDALRELAPVLGLPPLLLRADAGGDFLRFSRASDVGAAITTAPMIIRSADVRAKFCLIIYKPRLNSGSSIT